MAQSTNGGPGSRIGEVVDAPPGMPTPSETGFTGFWEKRLGLMYAPNSITSGVDLSVGAFIRFDLHTETGPSTGNTINVATNLSNF